MTRKEYNSLIQKQIKRCEDILIKKGEEYQANDNPLNNFEMARELSHQTKEQVLANYMLKHIVSVYSMINKPTVKMYSKEIWNEKIGDIINYLLILSAMINEEE